VFCYPPPKKKKRKKQNIISSTHTSRKQFLQPTDGNSQAQDPWGKSPQLTRLTNTPASPAIRRTIVRSVALLSAKCYLPTATCPAILQFNNPFPFQRLPQKYSVQNGAKNNKKKNETNKAKYFKLEFAFEQALKKKKKWQTICFYGKTKRAEKHCSTFPAQPTKNVKVDFRQLFSVRFAFGFVSLGRSFSYCC